MVVVRPLLSLLLVVFVLLPAMAQEIEPRTVTIADSYGVGEFALDVPPDWAVDTGGAGALTLAGPGNVLAVLLLVPRPLLPEYEVEASAPLTGVFAGFAAEGMDAPQGAMVAGLPALVGTQPGLDGDGAVALTVVVEQGDFVWVLLADADGAELGMAVEVLLAILDTGRYRYYNVQLPQVATAPDSANTGIITLRYPAGWVAEQGAAGVNLGNSQRALDNVNLEFIPLVGQVVGTVTVFPDHLLGQLGVDPAAATPVQVWEASLGFLVGASIGAQLEAAEPTTIGGRDAAALSFQLREAEGTIESRVIVIDAGDAYALMVFTAGAGQIAQFDPALFAIADALRYVPNRESAGAAPESTAQPDAPAADAPQTLSVPAGRGGVLALTVPPLWVLQDAGGAILFANRAATVGGMGDGYPESGQVAGYAGVIPRESLDVYGLAADAEPAAVLVAFLAQTVVEGVTAELAPTERLRFGDRDGAFIRGTQTDGANVFDVAYFALDAGAGVIVLNVIAPANSLDTYLEALLGVVASADYDE